MFRFSLVMPIIAQILATLLWLGFGKKLMLYFLPAITNRLQKVVIFTLFLISWAILAIDDMQSGVKTIELEGSLNKSKQEVNELKERESLRQWAMVVPTGEIATDTSGLHLKPAGILTTRHKEFFIREGSSLQFKKDMCSKEQYMQYIDKLKSLIKDYPKVPYAYVMLAMCLKEHDDPSWQMQAEQAKQVLEKLMAIQPHVLAIDGFYGLLVRNLLGLDVGKTGYFDVLEDGTYIPIGMPH